MGTLSRDKASLDSVMEAAAGNLSGRLRVLFTTVNPLNAAQIGDYPKTGGNLNEEASVTVISNTKNGNTDDTLYSPMFRVVLKGRGDNQDFNNATSFFMRIVDGCLHGGLWEAYFLMGSAASILSGLMSPGIFTLMGMFMLIIRGYQQMVIYMAVRRGGVVISVTRLPGR